MLAATPNRDVLEMQRDIIANTRLRRDVYAAAPRTEISTGAVALERLDMVAFTLTALPGDLPLRPSAWPLQFDFEREREAVGAVHDLLGRGPARAREIHRATGSASEQETSVLIQKLVVAGHLDACPPARGASGWPKLNPGLIEAGLRDRAAKIPLACPATGSATDFDALDAAAIEAALFAADADAAAHAVVARLCAVDRRFESRATPRTRRTVTDDEVSAYVAAMWRGLRDAASPGWRLLRLFGLVE